MWTGFALIMTFNTPQEAEEEKVPDTTGDQQEGELSVIWFPAYQSSIYIWLIILEWLLMIFYRKKNVAYQSNEKLQCTILEK